MEEEKSQSPEEKRKSLFRQQAEQMLAEGKEKGLRPPKPNEQWIEEYVGAMEGLHKLITEINKDFSPAPLTIGNFGSVELGWSGQKSPTENIGSRSLIVPLKESPKT